VEGGGGGRFIALLAQGCAAVLSLAALLRWQHLQVAAVNVNVAPDGR